MINRLVVFIGVAGVVLGSLSVILGQQIYAAKAADARPTLGAVAGPKMSPLPKMASATGVTSCGGTGSATTLRALMRNRINASTTGISFALEHDPRTATERFETVAAAAATLMFCAHAIPTFQSPVAPEDLGEYYRILNDMQDHALAVQIAAAEQDQERARHWVTHLAQDCVSCHARFLAPGTAFGPPQEDQ